MSRGNRDGISMNGGGGGGSANGNQSQRRGNKTLGWYISDKILGKTGADQTAGMIRYLKCTLFFINK